MLLTALVRTGRVEAADGAYDRAISREAESALRRFPRRRLAALRGPNPAQREAGEGRR